MKRVALITCEHIPEPDVDEALLLGALRDAGMDAHMRAWDGADGDLDTFDLAVLRSCWNYHQRVDDFVAWIDDTARRTRVANPEPVLRWNLHKRYLRELESHGIPIVPTMWCGRGESMDVAASAGERGWTDVVVKPAISAGSFRTRRFHHDDFGAAAAFLDEITAVDDAMVQRYMPSVEEPGERALVWIDGELTHAVCKSPRFADGVERVSEAMAVAPRDRELARAALEWVEADLLYARVDVVDDQDGAPILSELELLEPSLFLLQHRPALEHFVDAIRRW